ncbi:hypothetical protein NDK47_04715 [Brevibacillus ruminantium]|uniref:Uncharacterized protein n=1 Tax=Brevibacillus ruminantium TaxID=2950604 RepID=A0ABY4WHN4_9BACL|nr:hypothetical protein [Brevibacillus ruminantium]USG66607.1 hypothetical protein NDK47_04715 [Brevibacillus ruminantium]
MKANRLERGSLKKTLAVGAVIIGASTLLFQGLIQAVTAAEFKKTDTIPTSYANFTAASSQAAQNSLPAGYKKANYTVGTIDLEYYRNQTPTSKDMTKEAAAEIGAQALWQVFDLNLEGQVIQMGYGQATESLPRSTWSGDVYIGGKLAYTFFLDSVTGELFGLARSRTLDKQVSLAFDPVLAKNPQEYVELARKLAEKNNVVHSPIKTVEYNSQGYSNNDPDITMYVTGENGELATMSFSRYDKALLGIGYSTPTKHALEFSEKQMQRLQEKVKELEKSAPPAENETPFLRSIELD